MLLIISSIISVLASLLLIIISVIIIINLESCNLLPEVIDQSLANGIPLLSKYNKR